MRLAYGELGRLTLILVAPFCVAILSALGCSVDSSRTTGAAGSTGAAGTGSLGTAGTTGVGGTTGAAGAGDPSGSGGTTGAAGSSDPAGSAGTTGSAGTAGAAGGAGPAGASGAGGSTGGTGTGGSMGGRGGTTGGRGGTAGSVAGAGGRGGTSGTGGSTGTGGSLARFSFFVTSIGALRTLSGNQNGFGGDLRYGETGDGAGLRGADKICTAIAEMSMPGSGAKGWHAFLSAPETATTPVVNAIERIGSGPWYDRMGRLLSANLTNLMATRPTDADAAIKNDFPNENGVPNHSDGAPGCTGTSCPDNHDMLTGTGSDGKLYTGGSNPTCSGWTTAVGSAGKPRVGHSWPRGTGSTEHWMSALVEAGCAAGINLEDTGAPNPNDPSVGSGGGYGGFYCFAMTP